MWKILLLKVANCDAVDSHTEREVYLVEDQVMKTTIHLCPKCLLAQTKLRSKGRQQPAPQATP